MSFIKKLFYTVIFFLLGAIPSVLLKELELFKEYGLHHLISSLPLLLSALYTLRIWRK
jgi:hypothetical protein